MLFRNLQSSSLAHSDEGRIENNELVSCSQQFREAEELQPRNSCSRDVSFRFLTKLPSSSNLRYRSRSLQRRKRGRERERERKRIAEKRRGRAATRIRATRVVYFQRDSRITWRGRRKKRRSHARSRIRVERLLDLRRDDHHRCLTSSLNRPRPSRRKYARYTQATDLV